ncbi:MAG: hypothetical protein AAF724_18135 [Pseudomonadota bacterium]
MRERTSYFRQTTLGAMASLGFLAGLGAQPHLAHAETLTYGSPVSEQALFNRVGVIPLLDTLEEATEGRVEFRGLFGGTVVKMQTSLSAVRDGVVDSAFHVLSFYGSDLPFASIIPSTSAFGSDPIASMGAINEAFFVGCPQCVEDMKRWGQMPLMINTTTAVRLQCTREINASGDLDGLRVSVVTPPQARWVETLGMLPVRTSISDLLVSMQLGKTDCALVPISWAQSYGLIDLVKGVVDMPQGIPGGGVPIAISLAAWEKLSEEDRAGMIDAAAASVLPYVQTAYIDADADVRPKLEEVASFYAGDDAMRETWAEYQLKEIDELAELARERGIEDPEGFAQNIAEIYRKWHEEHLPVIMDNPEAMKTILLETVYSKVEF